MKDKQIAEFFYNYEKRFNDALSGEHIDIEGTVDAFSEYFLEASPAGINCAKNDEQFKQAIPRGFEFYRNIGTHSINIKFKEITTLDDLHSMVKVHWLASYQKGEMTDEIAFDVFYFLQIKDESIKIFAYITGDEQRVLKEHGLISQDQEYSS